jgi:N-acetylglucosamine kinase-like BadF-type ATPase
MTRLGLGIDAGGTATRWCLADAEGRALAEGRADPLSGHIFSDAAEIRARQIVERIRAAVLETARPDGIVAGITGLTRGAPAEALMRGLFAQALRLPPERVQIAEDMWIAYLARFRPGEGILVYSGTGSIGYYLAPDQQAIQVGGRGNLIDDGGSGFWMAREAIKAVLRAEEEAPGSGWSTPLGQALAGAIGGTSWNAIRAFVYGGDRGKIGVLARAVAEAASDPVARAILQAAGQELARLANSLFKRVGPRPVAVTGRAAHLHPLILEAFRGAIPPGSEVLVADVDAAHAAARLAAALP